MWRTPSEEETGLTMRRETIAKVMLAVALCAAPSTAVAQRRRGRGRQQEQQQPAQGGEAAGQAGGAAAGGESGSMTFTTDEATQTPPTQEQQPPTGGEAAPGGESVGLTGIGGEDVRAQRHPLTESIYAVQQIYALRNRRLEIQPTVAMSLNDPYVSHTGIGLGVNYWVTNVLAVGASFMWNQGLNGRADLDFRVARSAGLVVPINEYQMAAALNFSYVPVYGKFLMFNRFIFHWDLYLVAGVGLMRTRPIAVVDPEVRSFNYYNNVMFNAGVGVRVFVNRWLGIVGELRNYVYSEPLENTLIAPEMCLASEPSCQPRRNPATWQVGNALTDNVMAQVGITIFLPFSVSYRLQK
jgi:outer membrane beta-barrel protein